jgi:D-alanyl-D-alanine carboxypeptidase
MNDIKPPLPEVTNAKSKIGIKKIIATICMLIVAICATYIVTVYIKDATIDELQREVEEYKDGIETGKVESDELAKHVETNQRAEDEVLTPETATQPFEKDGVIVVNKTHPVPESYDPGDDAEAMEHLNELLDAAQADGISLAHSWSGFRSYATQAGLFDSYVANAGLEAAETFSARPGYSEHQTGLAFDLRTPSGNLYRIDDASYDYDTDWIAQHAADFGFIIRYRTEWQDVTGYTGEPWHLRYLGADLAKKVFATNQPLETYLGVDGGDYAWN